MAKTSKYSETELLGHIVELCETIQQEIADVTFDDFLTDRNLVDATAFRIQAIGEACSKLSDTFLQAHDLPWRQIIGMRHLLSHDYLGISHQVVWDTARADLDELLAVCRGAL